MHDLNLEDECWLDEPDHTAVRVADETTDRLTHGHRAKTDRRARCVAKRERKICVPPPRKRRPRPESSATVAQKAARRAAEARKDGRLSSL